MLLLHSRSWHSVAVQHSVTVRRSVIVLAITARSQERFTVPEKWTLDVPVCHAMAALTLRSSAWLAVANRSCRHVIMQVALATNIKICLPPSWCMMLKLPYSKELHRQAHK